MGCMAGVPRVLAVRASRWHRAAVDRGAIDRSSRGRGGRSIAEGKSRRGGGARGQCWAAATWCADATLLGRYVHI